jgi:SAM-dependent methyltransferase
MHDFGVFDYIYEYPQELKQIVFARVIAQITHGDVLDLGCGKAGLYWSLGYIQHVEQVSLFDYWEDAVVFLRESINKLSGHEVEKDYSLVISFLKKQQLLQDPCSYEALAEALAAGIVDVQPFDFLTARVPDRYDFVLCLQSLECVRNSAELDTALATVRTLLRPGGRCLGTVLRYQQAGEFTEKLIAAKLDGVLNPTADMLQDALQRNGFQHISLQKVAITGQNYYELLLFSADGNDEV